MRINHAQIHHDLLTALRQCTATQENLVKFNRNVRFFSGVDSALFNSTIVLLYTLYERRSDTVNFGRLLDLIQPSITTEDMASHTKSLEAIKPTWIRVGILRNEMVGHQTLDRDRAAVQSKANLGFSDVDGLLAHAKDLLFDISCRHFGTHLDYMDDSKSAVAKLLSRVAP